MLVSPSVQKSTKKHPSEFLVVSVSGTPFEMGVQYGEKAKEIIKVSSDYWFSQMSSLTEKTRPQMLESAYRSYDVTGKIFPEIYEEIKGTSQGSGVDLDSILIASYNNSIASDRTNSPGCSNFVALGPATAGGQSILGRNDDYNYAVRTHMVLVSAKPKDGNTWLGSRCGAIIGLHDGINDRQLASAWASVMQQPQERSDGMAFMQALQMLLCKSDSVEEAAKIISSAPKCVGGNYTVCGPQSAAVVEASGKNSHVRYAPKDGILLGTNHWRSEDMIERQGMNKLELEGSVYCPRYNFGERYLREHYGKLDVENFEEMLGSHGSPGGLTGICQHKDIFAGTMCSIVALPAKGVAYYSKGHPCANSFEMFRLEGN